MFYVNNDDMDELFRDAAERYPLKTEGTPDWEKVSALLQSEAGTPFADAGQYKKEKKRRVFFWWLLLLPLGWMGHESWQKINAPANDKKSASIIQNKQDAATKNAEATDNTITDKTDKATSLTIDKTDNKNKTNDKKDVSTATLIAGSSNKKNIDGKQSNRNKNLENRNFVSTKIADKSKSGTKSFIHNNQKKIANNIVAVGDKRNQIIDNGMIDKADKNSVATNINDNAENKNDDDSIAKETLHVAAQKNNADQKNTIAKVPDAVVKKESTPETVTEKKAAKSTVKLQKEYHFYAAIMAGVDVSTVKFQSAKGMGNSVGLLLGYHFSKSRFNIETGFYWDKKKYYSSGEYFNKNKLPPSWQNENLLYLNGNCNMFEIPINVRYNLIQRKATTLFAVAGLSSYLMNKEAYSYRLEDATGWAWDGNKSYYHSTQNWFSILNLSVGYEHHLGKIGDLRIEPYVKLPLSGIGLGSLSLSSAGLNVGLSRRF